MQAYRVTRRAPFVGLGQLLFRFRRTLFPLIVAPLILVLPPGVPFGNPALERLLDGLGVAFVLAGLGLRACVIGLEYIERGGRGGKVYASRLVTGGIFSVCRNPLYAGNILLLCGPISIAGNPWVAAIALGLAVLAYSAIVAAEEAFLERAFGADYRRYRATVNRWWPAVGRLRRAFAGSRFRWARVIVKDYNTIYLWSTITLIVFLHEHVWSTHARFTDATDTACAAAFAILTLAYVTARVLKKRRLLTQNGWRVSG